MSINSLKKLDETLDELIYDTGKYFLNENQISLDSNFWFNSNKDALNKGYIKENNDNNNLKLAINIDTKIYLSYMDSAINFEKVPEYDCGIESNVNYCINFKGQCENNLNVQLFIIGYDNSGKVQQHVLNLNESTTVKFDEKCSLFKIALRFSGHGIVDITSISFTKIDDKSSDEAWLEQQCKNKKCIFINENINNDLLKKSEIFIIDLQREMSLTSKQIINYIEKLKGLGEYLFIGVNTYSKENINLLNSLEYYFENFYVKRKFFDGVVYFKIDIKNLKLDTREVVLKLRQEKIKLANSLLNAYQKEKYMLQDILKRIDSE